MLLKNGSTGNYVLYLQYGLHIMCCPPGSFDSKFGSGTESAVKKYQAKKGLTQDGIVGDNTWNALVADIKHIQTLLKNKGYYTGNIDGMAGSGTYNAVIQFQTASGLTADGMVGSATLNALNSTSGGTTGGTTKMISLPTNRKCHWAQREDAITNLVGSSGCSLVAALNAANIVGPYDFTPSEVLDACNGWGASGLNMWGLPAECSARLDTSNYSRGGKSNSTVFAAIRVGIDNGMPVIVRLNKSGNNSQTHFVTAYGYRNGGTTAENIMVIDPNGGVERSLDDAGKKVSKTVYGDYIPCVKK